ncbi:hypothetical protein [Bacillus wiedmannii]|nr:hypothetical protein [Bacillus wiedmannii]
MTWKRFFQMRLEMYMKSRYHPYYHYDLETPDEVEMYNSLCHFFEPEQVQVQHLQFVFPFEYPYKIDFAIKPSTVTGTTYTLGIECDNKMGHSSTSEKEKDQFRTDLLKDLSVVIDIKRFNGKDIKADPYRCAKEALDAYRNIENLITDQLNEQLSEYHKWMTEAGTS